jgi:hypothetical protein
MCVIEDFRSTLVVKIRIITDFAMEHSEWEATLRIDSKQSRSFEIMLVERLVS